ncbi:MAG: phenylalanine--tRNA ligase subunit beta [Gemmatimonadaceae bacterium]|nr:phenylalanine--tRNA ligase subunit beta [Gemmatimonadaceae bacterium]
MLASYDWIRGFVPHTLTPDQLAALLSTHVATVDGVRALRADLAPIVVARVVEAARHPNSDHLWVTKVDDGSGTLQDVVCGAPNVTVGTLYPFARTGTTLPGGLTIERRKIRGETSNGMLCSARELGLGDDHEGILALSVRVEPGTPFLSAVDIGDTQIELDVLANRPDLFSQRGVAREVSALTGIPLVLPRELRSTATVPPLRGGAREASTGAGASVRIDDADGCSRYLGAVLRGVRVGPSPAWLVARLESVGSRSINNVVDVTNYCLHALGQPMHAFDLSTLAGAQVIVRRARDGETLVTLDGVTRTLSPEMTVIADATRAVAIAGVMGGRDSEVTATTTDILLEVAHFAPSRVRRTRRTLGLSTDASYRFERGVDAAAAPQALTLAVQMLLAVAGGTVEGGPVDVGQAPAPHAPVRLEVARVARLLGQAVPASEITKLLGAIGFSIEALEEGVLSVRAPSWRLDISRDVDLIEEIARLRGFDALPDVLTGARPGTVPDHPLYVLGRRVRDVLVAQGLHEIRPMPFVAARAEGSIRVANPLSDDEPFLRDALATTLAARAEFNLARMQRDVRLFEVGSVFLGDPDPLPREEVRVGALIMGARRPPHFTEPVPPDIDAWDAKALAETLVETLYGTGGASLVPVADDTVLWHVEHEGRRVGHVMRATLDAPVWAAPAFVVECTIGEMPTAPVAAPGAHAGAPPSPPARRAPTQYRPLPTTPSTSFDLALLVPDAIAAATVEMELRRAAGELLEELTLFDQFVGAGVAPGMRSLAWRLVLRHPERTLREKEIEGRRRAVIDHVRRTLGIDVRG